MRHFLNLSDAGGEAIAAILGEAMERKERRAGWLKGKPDTDKPLDGAVLAMIFEKSSTRTRVSFDLAIRQLGGSAVILETGSSQLGRGETIADTARVDRKSTRLNSSHSQISYAVFCLKKKKKK